MTRPLRAVARRWSLLRRLGELSPVTRLLVLGQLAFNLGFFLVLPFLAVHLAEDLALAGGVIGLVLGLRTFSQQGLFFLGGALADRFGTKPVVLVGFAIRILGFVLLALADGLPLLLAGTVATGFAAALFSPAVEAELARRADDPVETGGMTRAEVFALFAVCGEIGAVVGPVLGGLLLAVDFAVTTLVAAGVFGIVAVAFLRLLPRAPAAHAGEPMLAGWRRVLTNRAFLAFTVAYSTWLLSYNQLYLALPVELERATGDARSIGWFFAMAAGMVVLLQLPVAGFVRNRVGPARALPIGFALLAASFAVVAVTAPLAPGPGLAAVVPAAAFVIDADGQPQPGLAESWTGDDPSTWRLTLRDGVTFHDGTPLTAEVAADGLRRATEATPTPRSLVGTELTVTAEGEDTVVIGTASPDPVLVQRLSSPELMVLSPAAYQDPSAPSPLRTGTGPFVLEELQGTSTARLERFDDYWAGPAAAAGADVRFISEGASRANALRAGELDIAATIPVSQLATIVDQEVASVPLPRTVTLYLNQDSPVFGDPGPPPGTRWQASTRRAASTRSRPTRRTGCSGPPARSPRTARRRTRHPPRSLPGSRSGSPPTPIAPSCPSSERPRPTRCAPPGSRSRSWCRSTRRSSPRCSTAATTSSSPPPRWPRPRRWWRSWSGRRSWHPGCGGRAAPAVRWAAAPGWPPRCSGRCPRSWSRWC